MRTKNLSIILLSFIILSPLVIYAQSGNGRTNAINAGGFQACGIRNYSDARSNYGFSNNYSNSNYPQPDGQPSPDVWYTFTVSDIVDIQISTCGTTGFDTYIHLLDPSGYLITGNDNAACGTASTITYNGLTAGTYYAVVEGNGSSTGSYVLNIGTLSSSCGSAPLGDNMSNPIVFNTFSPCGGSVSDSRWNSAFGNDYGQPSKDIFYRITLPSAMTVTVSHCGSNFDTYVTILNSSGGYVTYNNDNNNSPCQSSQAYLQTTLPAGTYYVVSEGYGSNTGFIVTTITAASALPPPPGANMTNAIYAGTFSGVSSFSDSRSNAEPCLGDDYGQPGNDIFYKFTLTKALSVVLSHCGSEIDTYLHLLNSAGELISSNDNSPDSPCPGYQAYLRASLQPGSYYVVSEGNLQNTGIIVTGIQVFGEDCPPLWSSASNDRNYIITYTPRVPLVNTNQLEQATVCQVQETIQYFDGLGRPSQTVQVKGSPDARKDIILPFSYDQYGREVKKYLPYAGSASGNYRVNGQGEVVYYYQDQPAGMAAAFNTPYAQTVFDNSPLDKVIEQGAPGNAWQPASSGFSGSGHTMKMEYGIAEGAEVFNWNSTPDLHIVGIRSFFSQGQVFKTTFRDENWISGKAGSSEEFKDKKGRLVLKRNWETESRCQSTYYVYDMLDNLLYVLPPEITETGNSVRQYYYESDSLFLKYAYAYHYDHRNRVIEKKIPGKGWEYFIYNKMDQLVASQDAVQRKTDQWLVYKYDAMGRIVMTGLTTATRSAAQSGVDTQGSQWESRTDSGNGYTSNCWPGSLTELLSVNYYDSYDFPGNTYGTPSGLKSTHVTGLLTGSRVKVLGTSALLLTVNYYDEKGRLVQSRADNHLGGTDADDFIYNFTGQVLTHTRTHTTGGQVTTIATLYSYDHMGRKLQTTESINGAAPVILSKLTYSETGQLKDKSVHSTDGGANFLNKTSYSYNPRGWLKSQGNTAAGFSMNLSYEDGANPQYNGNISAQNYTNGGSPNTFTYQYDKLNRLTSAVATGMSEVLTYDDMGNIKSLNRDNAGARAYTYSGNQLLTVAGLTTVLYQYDDNGNVKRDGRNGKTIAYNYLNLPETVSGGLSYLYDAAGRKLRKNNNGVTRDYVSGIEYSGTSIETIRTEEGVARNNGGVYSYEYNLTDHLGNVRATFYRNPVTGSLEVFQRDNYYAFGKRKIVQDGSNRYLYNGKELQDELGEYDYGSRFYDPEIGRFTTIDPLAEMGHRWSPYVYAFDNPVRFIDPDGMWPDDPTITKLSKSGNVQTVSETSTNTSIGKAKDGIRTVTTVNTTASVDVRQVDTEGGMELANSRTITETTTHTQSYDAESKSWVDNNDTKTTTSTTNGYDGNRFQNVGAVANDVKGFGVQNGSDLYSTMRSAGKAGMSMTVMGATAPLGISGLKMDGVVFASLKRLGLSVGPSTGATVGALATKGNPIIMAVGSYQSKIQSFNNSHPPAVRAVQNALYKYTLGLFEPLFK